LFVRARSIAALSVNWAGGAEIRAAPGSVCCLPLIVVDGAIVDGSVVGCEVVVVMVRVDVGRICAWRVNGPESPQNNNPINTKSNPGRLHPLS
jgi:hypothetical protein